MGNIWAGGTELDFTPSLLTVLFLRGDGSLTLEHPGASERVSTWIADPVNPIPTLGGNVQNIRPCGPQDQTPVERDFAASIVLFQTEVLPTTLLVHGLVAASLFIASDAPDTDVNVKVRRCRSSQLARHDTILRYMCPTDSLFYALDVVGSANVPPEPGLVICVVHALQNMTYTPLSLADGEYE